MISILTYLQHFYAYNLLFRFIVNSKIDYKIWCHEVTEPQSYPPACTTCTYPLLILCIVEPHPTVTSLFRSMSMKSSVWYIVSAVYSNYHFF